MSIASWDEMEHDELIEECARLAKVTTGLEIQKGALFNELNRVRDEKSADYVAANVAVGAIYRMVDLIKNTSVTHAQREGNFLLLLAFIDKCWPSHNGRSYQSTAGDDIPF